MFSILTFLIGWLAWTSRTGNNGNPWFIKRSVDSNSLFAAIDSFSPSSVENYLPQLCNILLDGDYEDAEILDYFSNRLFDICRNSFSLSFKFLSCLRSSQSPSDNLFHLVLNNGASRQDKDERYHWFQENMELCLLYGKERDDSQSMIRSSYAKDVQYFIDSLCRIGRELKACPAPKRLDCLKSSISDINDYLLKRFVNHHNNIYDPPVAHSILRGYYEIHPFDSSFADSSRSINLIAKMISSLPRDSFHCLYYPLALSTDPVARVLRFLPEESRVLQSKTRTPIVVVAEILSENYTYNDHPNFYTPQSCPKRHDFLPQSDHSLPVQVLCDQNSLFENVKSKNNHVGIRNSKSEKVSVIRRDSNSNRVSSHISSHISSHASGGSSASSGSSGSSHSHRRAIPSNFIRRRTFTRGTSGDTRDTRGTSGGTRSRSVRQPVVQADQIFDRDVMFPPSSSSNALSLSWQQIIQDASPLGSWDRLKEKWRSRSPFSKLPGWNLKAFIVKSGDDLRKEHLAMQLIECIEQIFVTENLEKDIFLRPYQILCTGYQSGFIEYIEDTLSIDAIKKYSSIQLGGDCSLRSYFERVFGPPYTLTFANAVDNFVKSLVGYSLVTYLLQVKDRHNANILIDAEGHLIHIDYGFVLGDSPGFNINFENAPFKLTREYLDLMGGINSPAFLKFQDLFVKGFEALRGHVDVLVAIIELHGSDGKRSAGEGLKSRLLFPSSYDDILSLIRDSIDSWRTKQYDVYQYKTNGIMI